MITITPLIYLIILVIVCFVICYTCCLSLRFIKRVEITLRIAIDEQKETLEQLKDAYNETEKKLKRVKDLTDRVRYIRANKKER